MRIVPTLLVTAALGAASAGCADTCAGPSCETTWSVTDLALHTPESWTDAVDPLLSAQGVVVGSESQGVGWTVEARDGLVLIGQPDARRVVAVTPPTGNVQLAAIARDLAFVTDDLSFGASIAMGSSWVAIGAPDANLGTGAVWLFRDVPADGRVDATQGLRLVGQAPADHTGTQVMACPDVDGDGIDEWLFTAPTLTQGNAATGGVWWVLSSDVATLSNGSVSLADVGTLWVGNTTGERFGTAALCTADFDGDTLPDVVIGAPLAGSSQSGRLTLIAGSSLTTPESAARTELSSIQNGDWLGSALTAGQFTPDGPMMLAAGAPGANGGTGRVALFLPTSLVTGGQRSPDNTVSPASTDAAEGHFGRTVHASDIDGDGLTDLLVGAPDSSVNASLAAGELYVWLGGSWTRDLVGGQDYRLRGHHAFQRVGRWTSVVDIDDDDVGEVFLSLRADADR